MCVHEYAPSHPMAERQQRHLWMFDVFAVTGNVEPAGDYVCENQRSGKNEHIKMPIKY